MGDLSLHFDRAEFRCKGHGVRGHVAHPTIVDPRLVDVLEKIRAITGRPLRIVSGHRCQWYNARIGGARRSQHLLGTAADIPPGRSDLAQARRAGAIGVGTKGASAVHVDVRAGRLAHWTY